MPWRCYIGRRLGGAILVKSGAMSMAAHKANRNRGQFTKDLYYHHLAGIGHTVQVAATAPTVVLTVPLFLLQVWACVKVQLATGKRKRAPRK